MHVHCGTVYEAICSLFDSKYQALVAFPYFTLLTQAQDGSVCCGCHEASFMFRTSVTTLSDDLEVVRTREREGGLMEPKVLCLCSLLVSSSGLCIIAG